MPIYTVTTGTVAVRPAPSASASITNILPAGTTIYSVDEDSGWLRTTGGYYIFKSDNIELSLPTRSLRGVSTLSATPTINQPGVVVAQPGSTTVNPTTGGIAVSAETIKEEKNKTKETKAAKEETEVSDKDKADSSDPKKNESQRNEELSKSVEMSKVMPIGNTVKVIDKDGNIVDKEITNDIANDLVGVQVITKDGKEYVVSEDSEGNQYLTELGRTNVLYIDEKGESSYKRVDRIKSDLTKTEGEKQEESLLDQIGNLGSKIIQAWTDLTDLTVEDSRIIHGMPYQFMPIVDPRMIKDNETKAFNAFGRKFSEKIVARAPILYMQAGMPIFLRGYSDEAKGAMLESLMTQIENSDDSEIKKLLNDSNAQYYSFDECSTLYFKAVNSACTVLAHLLQIESVQIDTLRPHEDDDTWGQTVSDFLNPKSLGNINWGLRTAKSLGFYRGAVAFYINSETQIQETLVNGTRTSQLASKINQVSDSVTEAAFLLGGMGGNAFGLDAAAAAGQMLYANRNKSMGNGDETKEYLGSTFIGSAINNISNLISGGKMNIPEIWSDSQFSRSYNVTIKLDSPDSDTVSVFLNVLVPLIHILGFVLPRSAGANMYSNPFLVRCFYKSTFHIDMGIITSCSITKGDAGAWNQDGLPTQVTVELQIKDLYNHMSQATGMGSNTLISNPAQLEYLANLAGVNIAPASFTRALELWFAVKGINRMKQGIVGWASDMLQSVVKTVAKLGVSNTRWAF